MNESNENPSVAVQETAVLPGPVPEAGADTPASPDPQRREQSPEKKTEQSAEKKQEQIPEQNPEPGAGNPGETGQTEGTPPSDASVNPEPEPPPEQKTGKETAGARPSGRNFEAEWKELAEAHPEVVGTTLPQDIFQACITSDRPPLQVYESMMLQHLQSEISQLKQENDRLRQNADNAQRAPVTGTSNGGSAHTEEEDPFVTAFKRYH